MTRVTIVGGGYGGITIAKALDDVAEVVLVEQKDTFVNHAESSPTIALSVRLSAGHCDSALRGASCRFGR